METPLLVSACLVGFRCRYDGSTKLDYRFLSTLESYSWFAVCPEQMAGFPTPRKAIFFVDGTGETVLRGEGRIYRSDGVDVTEALLKSCQALVAQAARWGIEVGILKEKSPSCGVTCTYVKERLVEGKGIFSALLSSRGMKIFSEETWRKVLEGKGRDF